MSDAPNASSGFGTAFGALMNELGKLGNECYYLAWQYYGQPEHFASQPNVTILPNFGGHPFGGNSLTTHLMHVRPDMLLALGDFHMTQWIINLPRIVPYCHWFPIDGTPIPTPIRNWLRYTDMKVCFSKFGLAECEKAGIANVSYIPHGVDGELYHPDPAARQETRKQFGTYYNIPDIEKKFIVGQVNRNQRRKMFDRWLQTMQIVCQKDPDIIGWLHCDYNEPRESGGWDIPYMIERLGLQGRIFQTPQYVNYMYGLTSQRMNQLYNSFDIHFSATGGEGFGLSTVESQAAGLPNVITDYTTSKELVQDHGELVKVETFEVCGAGVDRALIDMNDAAERILKLKNDSELRRKYSLAAREHMLCEYNWAGIGKAFNSYLTKMLA